MYVSLNTLCFIVLANLFVLCYGQNGNPEKTYRLSNNINVNYYDVYIEPNLEPDFQFTGRVSIDILVLENTDYFTLNSKNLEIKEVKVHSKTRTYKATYELIAEQEILKIRTSSINAFSNIYIDIKFIGKINDDFKGLYKVQYEENGLKKWLLTTQLEPTYARMVFPCFDEPEYRAQFTITVSALRDQQITSTTPVAHVESTQIRKVLRFYTTPRMPTHAVSITIHQFRWSAMDSMVNTKIHARKHENEHWDYFLSQYKIWFAEIEKYLEYPIRDHRMELVAIPDADEYLPNAGLTVYKESDIFFIDGIDVDQHREKIARTAIHKLTHIWFSIFATIKWWSDTWLRESSAILFEYLILARVQPIWKVNDRFLLDVVQSALFEEEYISDTSLSSPTGYSSEIQAQKFNSFINKKGASILGMLQHVVTEERFRKAIRKTLISGKNRRNFIEPKSFSDQLQNEIRNDKQWPKYLTIQAILDSWTSNSGYPLITVATEPQGTVVIEQETYRSPRSLVEIPDQRWIVPIQCTTQLNPKSITNQPTIWLSGQKNLTTNINLKKEEWILCNSQQTGYYRVQYPEENWALLANQLNDNPNKIHVRSRAQLIDDSFHLAIYNKLPFSTAFQIGTYLKNEKDILPWLSLVRFAKHLLQLYEQTSAEESLKNYFGSLFEEKLKKIGFNKNRNENYAETTGRLPILELACSTGVQSCLEQVAEIYQKHVNDLTRIPAEQKYLVYCNSFKTSENQQYAWNRLWDIYEKSQIMSERQLILKSLACANDEILLKKYTNLVLKPQLFQFKLYQYEKDIIIKSATQSFKGLAAALDTIAEILPNPTETQSQDIIKILTSITNQTSVNVVSRDHLIKLRRIIAKVDRTDKKNGVLFETLKRAYVQGLDKTVDYRKNNAEEIVMAVYKVIGYHPESSNK